MQERSFATSENYAESAEGRTKPVEVYSFAESENLFNWPTPLVPVRGGSFAASENKIRDLHLEPVPMEWHEFHGK